jgi:hypothetical protein
VPKNAQWANRKCWLHQLFLPPSLFRMTGQENSDATLQAGNDDCAFAGLYSRNQC